MLDKSTNSEEVPQLIERHLLDQYSIDRRGKAVLVCNFFVFLTFNINYSHLCLGAVVNDIYLIPSICILIVMLFFSFLLQRKIDNYISKSKENIFCEILENNFGSVCSQFFEVLSVIWIGFYFIATFIIGKETVLILFEVKNDENLVIIIKCIYCVSFFFLIVLINAIESTIWIDINIIISFFINFGIILMLIFYMIYGKKQTNTEMIDKLIGNVFKLKIIEWKDKIFNAITIFTSCFNNVMIFFWLNKKFKRSNMTVKKHRIFILLNYVFNFLFYSLFIAKGILFKFDKQEYYLDFLLKADNNKLAIPIILFNVIYQILLMNFYIYIIKRVIVRSKQQKIFKQSRYVISCSAITLGLIVLTFWVKNPYNIIIVNNSTVGFIINFIIPSLLLVKKKLTFTNSFLLFGTFILFAICLSCSYSILLNS